MYIERECDMKNILIFRIEIDYIFKIILIFEGTIYLKRDYDLKNIFTSAGTKIIEGTMILRPLLIPRGHYNSKRLLP